MKDHFFSENSNHCFTTITEFSEESENESENVDFHTPSIDTSSTSYHDIYHDDNNDDDIILNNDDLIEVSTEEIQPHAPVFAFPKYFPSSPPYFPNTMVFSVHSDEILEDDQSIPVYYYFAVIPVERSTYFGWFQSLAPVTGFGYSFNNDGSYYCGEFLKDEKNGFGEFYYDNGSHYDGYWKHNFKEGNGRFFFNNDLFYKGKWTENKMIDCELKYTQSICSDIQYVYSFITSHNDYIFFKQAQISIALSLFYSYIRYL